MTILYPAALVIHGETVQNKFPGWHEILKGSRNSNVNERIDARFKFKASQFTQDTINSMANNDRQTAQEDDLNDDSDDSDIEVTMTSPQPANTTTKGTPPATNSKLTQPHRSLFSDNKLIKSTEKIKRQAPSTPIQTPPVSPKQRQPRHLSIFTPNSKPVTDQNARPPNIDSTDNVSPDVPSS